MKKLLYSLIIIVLTQLQIVAEVNVNTSQPQTVKPKSVQPASEVTNGHISYETCTKMFNTDKECLFYLTLGAVNDNRFKIEEIQTNNGYIIFHAAGNKYLATIAGIDKNNSILKITPCNNFYYFQSGIISNIYKYIDLNINADPK